MGVEKNDFKMLPSSKLKDETKNRASTRINKPQQYKGYKTENERSDNEMKVGLTIEINKKAVKERDSSNTSREQLIYSHKKRSRRAIESSDGEMTVSTKVNKNVNVIKKNTKKEVIKEMSESSES